MHVLQRQIPGERRFGTGPLALRTGRGDDSDRNLKFKGHEITHIRHISSAATQLL